jgi:type IV pilus modification protein PilV
MKQLHRARRRAQAGFTLIEALVALLVMSFGMLALAGMQIAMTRGSDVAKQRSEAVRLAQLKMEELRSYDGLNPSASTTYTYSANVVSNMAGETICPSPTCVAPLDSATNTTFTRQWFVTDATGAASAPANAAQKWIRVLVTWTDRAGQLQSVTLNSVIARNDPIALKGLIGGQGRGKTRYPKNRQINIPYPAVTLSGGNTSAFIPPPGSVIYVFNNDTGNVTQSCTATAYSISSIVRVGSTATVTASGHPFVNGNRVTISGATPGGFNGDFTVSNVVAGVSFDYTVSNSLATPATLTSATVKRLVTLVEGLDLTTLSPSVTCTSANAFLLSGFVRFRISGSAATAANLTDENQFDTPLLLSAANPVTIDSSATGNGPQSYTCFAQSQEVIQASNQSPVTITSTVRSSNVVTVTTSGNHGYAVGQRVSIAEVSNFKFNGSFTVESVPTSTTFTYAQEDIDTSATGGTAALIQRLTVPAGTSVPGYNNLITKFIAYTCVVTPDPSLTGDDANSWWGEAKLVTNGSWSFGTTNSDYKVCRFSGNYTNDATISNHEHPRYYRRVKPAIDQSGTLDNQNYLVIKGNDNCPADVAADPVNGDFINTSTITHQTVASGADSNAELSFGCTNVTGSNLCAGGSKTPIEPATVTVPLPMF